MIKLLNFNSIMIPEIILYYKIYKLYFIFKYEVKPVYSIKNIYVKKMVNQIQKYL